MARFDKVRVLSGLNKGLKGTVIEVNGNTVTVRFPSGMMGMYPASTLKEV